MQLTWKTIRKGEYLYGLVPNHPKATKNGYVLEHRLVMEVFLGRYLTDQEIVHHRDENKHNNALSNLQLTDRFSHNHTHKKPRKMEERICPVCGISFIRKPQGKADIGRIPCCSRSCNGVRSQKIQTGNWPTP